MTNERAAIPTLVFDEVDVGIGGKTAAVVGQLLRQLGKRVQVLCVTHQPQVAAFAHYHWAVKKRLDEEISLTYAVPLSMQERAVELAAMLGGMNCGDEAHFHAKRLLEESQCESSVHHCERGSDVVDAHNDGDIKGATAVPHPL